MFPPLLLLVLPPLLPEEPPLLVLPPLLPPLLPLPPLLLSVDEVVELSDDAAAGAVRPSPEGSMMTPLSMPSASPKPPSMIVR